MPTPLLDAYAAQLPRLTAEESLTAANRVAVGSGSLKKGEGRRIANDWQRAMGHARTVVRPKGRAEYDASMAMLGIGLKREPKAKPDA